MKIAFYVLGSKGFYVLKEFLKFFGRNNISFIVSSDDKGVKKDYYNEITELAKKNKLIFYYRKEDISKIERDFKGYKFAIGWRWLIQNYKNLIVFHDSILPKYRGFAPLVNALINGETEIGVTALFGTEEYDKGEIIMQKKISINYPIKIYKAIRLIEPLYFELVREIYFKILNREKIKSFPQDETYVSYSIWLDKRDYFIDWSWDADKIKRFVDAVDYPYDNAKSRVNGRLVKIKDVEIVKDIFIINRERHIGKVIFFINGCPVVICGSGLIKITNININKIPFRSRFY